MAGKVSRSIDTRPPSGDALEHGGLEHVGACIDLVGRGLVARRLLDEGQHPAFVIGRHHAEGGRIATGCRAIVPSAPRSRWKATESGEIEVTEHVTVDDDEGLVDSGESGGEADGAGRVERLGLDGVGQPHAGDLAVGIGLQ